MPRWTTKGDKLLGELTPATNKIPYFTGANTAGSLDLSTNVALGTSNTTIPTQNAVKAYVDAAAGAAVGITLLNTTTVSGSPTRIHFTSLITGSYKFYRVYFNGLYCSGSPNGLNIQVSTTNGSTYATTGHDIIRWTQKMGGTISTTTTSSASSFRGDFSMGTTAGTALSGIIEIMGSSSDIQHVSYQFFNQDGGDFARGLGAGQYRPSGTPTAFNAFRFNLDDIKTFEGGVIKVYGYL